MYKLLYHLRRSNCDKSHAADRQAKSVNDGKTWSCVNLNEKSVPNGPKLAFCLINHCGTIGTFMQYGPFVSFAIATRPEIHDCSSYALPTDEERFTPVAILVSVDGQMLTAALMNVVAF